MSCEILVLYYSSRGAVRQMAQLFARGIEQVSGATARIRTVPRVASITENFLFLLSMARTPAIPEASSSAPRAASDPGSARSRSP